MLAATPACISVYTPSNTGPLTPSVVQDLHESPQVPVFPGPQIIGLNQHDILNGQIPSPPSILNNPRLASIPLPSHQHNTHDLLMDVIFTDQEMDIPSPASSPASIVLPHPATFTGQSPAIAPRPLSVFPRIIPQTSGAFRPQSKASLTENPTTPVWSQTELISAASSQGRYRQAEEDQLRGELSMIEVMLGKSHWEYLDKARLIGGILYEQGRYKSAEDMAFTSLLEYQKDNRDDIYTIRSSILLGDIFCAQGLYSRAEKLEMKTIQVAQNLLGWEHTLTLNIMGSLASTYYFQGRFNEAQNLGEQVLEKHERILEYKHPNTIKATYNLANIYQAQQRFKEAEDLLLRVLAINTTVLGQEHPKTLPCIYTLAHIYGETNRFIEAEDLMIRTMQMIMKVLGQEHPITLLSMHRLAIIWKRLGRHEEAIELITQCVGMRTRILGSGHPHTLGSRRRMSEWQK